MGRPHKSMWPFPGVLHVPQSGPVRIRVQGQLWRLNWLFLVVHSLYQLKTTDTPAMSS